MADVLWAVHRGRFLFYGALEPAFEIAFGNRARATPIPGTIQHDALFNSHRASPGFDDFLAGPRAANERIQGKKDSTRILRL